MDNEESKTVQEGPHIYLVENDLFDWERPSKPGWMHIGFFKYNAKTEPIESLGLDIVNEVVEGYHVVASAAKYLANVIRLNSQNKYGTRYRDAGEEVDGPKEDLVVFNGNISIYSTGQIPGTELQGYDLEESGKIWLARPSTELFRNPEGLYEVIFGEDNMGKIARIEAILKGINQIKIDKGRGESRARHKAYQRARGDEQERIHGTFGRGF